MMYLTAAERDSIGRDDRPNPGLVVVRSDGSRHFFPAGSEQLGMAFARFAFREELDDPRTLIEYGRKHGTKWVCEHVLKAPTDPSDRPDRP